MNNFKNLKIQVENNLDEIVKTLESKGCIKSITYMGDPDSTIIVMHSSGFSDWLLDTFNDHQLTTLAELKEM